MPTLSYFLGLSFQEAAHSLCECSVDISIELLFDNLISLIYRIKIQLGLVSYIVTKLISAPGQATISADNISRFLN